MPNAWRLRPSGRFYNRFDACMAAVYDKYGTRDARPNLDMVLVSSCAIFFIGQGLLSTASRRLSPLRQLRRRNPNTIGHARGHANARRDCRQTGSSNHPSRLVAALWRAFARPLDPSRSRRLRVEEDIECSDLTTADYDHVHPSIIVLLVPGPAAAFCPALCMAIL
jgi:hypothetical protein